MHNRLYLWRAQRAPDNEAGMYRSTRTAPEEGKARAAVHSHSAFLFCLCCFGATSHGAQGSLLAGIEGQNWAHEANTLPSLLCYGSAPYLGIFVQVDGLHVHRQLLTCNGGTGRATQSHEPRQQSPAGEGPAQETKSLQREGEADRGVDALRAPSADSRMNPAAGQLSSPAALSSPNCLHLTML